YYWERTAKFVKDLPVPRQSDEWFAPYFLDATEHQLINDCPQLHDPGSPPRSRYCSYMFNLHSARNFFEPHNLADIQNYQMLSAVWAISRPGSSGGSTNGRTDRVDGLVGLKSFGIRYVAVEGTDANALAVRDIDGAAVSLLDLGPITAEEISARSVAF